MIEDIVERLGLVVEGDKGRNDGRSEFREQSEVSQVTEMQRSLSWDHDQRPLLFECHISSARQKALSDSVRDLAYGFHTRGYDNHGRDGKRAACDRGCDIVLSMNDIGEFANLLKGPFGALQAQGNSSGFGQDEMGLNGRFLPENLEKPNAIQNG